MERGGAAAARMEGAARDTFTHLIPTALVTGVLKRL